ncbi:MAG: HU family DNA-binding protein [Vigna little leaf phytoplasma]|nr:HU family DNA-binding protein [Vigna little leaf phytoplasma]MDV3198101.1 HU family DNA-binding protein [Vigna little leaf phytoplasma]
MTKKELILKMSEQLGVSVEKTREFFTCLKNNIKEALLNKDKVIVEDLGIIKLRSKKERTCKVPKSQQVVVIPAKEVPVFIVNKKFKELFSSEK